MIRMHIGLVALVFCTVGCQVGSYGPDELPPPQAKHTVTNASPPTHAPPVPLTPGQATARVLAQLHRVGSELSPKIAACHPLPPELATFVSSIASQAKLVQVRIGAGATTDSLAAFAGLLRDGLAAVSKRTADQPELRRLQAELTAAVRDLIETLQLLAGKLPDQDVLAIEQARARLRNAAGNFGTTVRTLVSECASAG